MTTCINNLRQIGLGVKMYVGDEGKFPAATRLDADEKMKQTDQTIGGYSPIQSHAPYWLSDKRRPLFQYVPPSQVYRCSADKGARRWNTMTKPPDDIVPEPTGGSHTNHELAATLLDAALSRALADVSAMPSAERLEARYRKFRAMGNVGITE